MADFGIVNVVSIMKQPQGIVASRDGSESSPESDILSEGIPSVPLLF